jgi:hypothetical protein
MAGGFDPHDSVSSVTVGGSGMGKTSSKSKAEKETGNPEHARKASMEKALASYWSAINRCEEFIRENGHYLDPHWESRSSNQLELAYKSVKRHLRPISEPRLIRKFPGEVKPFWADNFHHALILLLSPPHRWFGQIGVLDRNAYQQLKRKARSEERDLVKREPLTNSIAAAIDELTESERSVYKAVGKRPALGKTIGNKVDVHPDNVRKYLAKLTKLGLIRHIRGKGYARS